jgi:3-hydroxyacyl-[acyl-carrier-protein] dehydratase
MVMDKEKIISMLPYGKSFRFVNELLHVDENGAVGIYTFARDLPFYHDHFIGFPITPAVILTEVMAQIGLVCLGIYLLGEVAEMSVAMTSNQMEFIKPVFPGEKVKVTSEKIYFRFNKLSCKVKMENAKGELVSKGTISGMLIAKQNA